MYYSFVYPYLLYGILIWGDAANAHLNSLFLIQKKIIRIITLSEYLAPTRPLFLSTEILKLKDIYRFSLGIHMYKEQTVGNVRLVDHQYNTRNHNNAVPIFQRLAQSQRSLSYNGPIYWNLIPYNIKNSSSLSVFKKLYKKFLVSQYAN